jgi:hypothetical protein
MRHFTDTLTIFNPKAGDTMPQNANGVMTPADPDDPTAKVVGRLIYIYDDGTRGASDLANDGTVNPHREWSIDLTPKADADPLKDLRWIIIKLWIDGSPSSYAKVWVIPGAYGGGTITINSPLAGSNVQSAFTASGGSDQSPTMNLVGSLTSGSTSYGSSGTQASGSNWTMQFPAVSTTIYNAVLKIWCADDPNNTWTQESLAVVYPPPPPPPPPQGGGGGKSN